MVGLSLLLWWVPVLGPATVGYIGGRKSGRVMIERVRSCPMIGVPLHTDPHQARLRCPLVMQLHHHSGTRRSWSCDRLDQASIFELACDRD